MFFMHPARLDPMAKRNQYESVFEKALELGRQRQYEESIELLTKLVAETDDYPQAWLYLGRARHAQGMQGAAIGAFAEYIARAEKDPNGWFFLGREYLGLGLVNEAVRSFRTSLEYGKDSPELWTFLGIAELKRRRTKTAISCLEKAMEQAPDDQRIFRAYCNALYTEAIRLVSRGEANLAGQMLVFIINNKMDGVGPRSWRAKAYREQGLLAEALADLETARDYEPEDRSLAMQTAVLYFANGRPRDGLAIMDEIGAPSPGLPEDRLDADSLERWRAALSFSEGDYRTTLNIVHSLIRKGEKDSSIRALAAQSNYEMGRYEKAEAHYRQAISLDPKSPDLRLGLALCLWEQGKRDEAKNTAGVAARYGANEADYLYIETLCDAYGNASPSTILPKVISLLKVRHGDPRLIFILAENYYKTGRPDLAGPWFEKLKAMDYPDEMVDLYLISVAESLNDKKSAIKACRNYLEKYPDNRSIRKDYVAKLLDSSRWAETIAAIEEGFAYGLRGRGAERILGRCYTNTKRWRDAATVYRSLLRSDPANPKYLLALTASLENSGARELALAVLSRGAVFIGRKAEPFLALGEIYIRAKKPEEAVRAFTKASELAPADPRPLRALADYYKKAGIGEMAARFSDRAEKLEMPLKRRK